MKSAKEKYMEMSFDLFPVKEYEQLIEEFGDAEEKELLNRKAELLLPHDLKITCAMLDAGYSLRDMALALNECSLFAKHLPTPMPNEQRRYADEVMGRVNDRQGRKAGENFRLAEGYYLLRANKKKLNIAQEGDIVLSMLAEGFAAETVEQVLRTHGTDEEYAHALVLTCSRVAQIYNEIQAASPVSEIRTAKEAYRSFAGAYMREHHLSKLDRKSDRGIVRRMLAKGWKEESIRNALRFSPVAAEPWRDKEQYVDAICSYVFRKQKRKQGADDRYALTASMYEEKMNRLNQALLKKNPEGINANRTYYDGIVARELLEEHQLRGNVERAIAEKSSQTQKEAGKNSSQYRYASLIVAAAYAVLRAEHALLETSAKQIPAGNSYATLKAQGITADDLYKDAILRRVQDYPSTAGRLTEPFIDLDAAEYLFARYPDMNRHDIEDAIHFGSPRAQMPGVSMDYPMRVIDEVYARMENFAEQQKKQQEFRREMETFAQSEKDAVTAGDPTWNLALCTGLAAVRMLQTGYTPMDVLPALVQPPDIMETDAGKIVEGAESVLNRLHLIQQYAPFSDAEKKKLVDCVKLAEDEYMRRFRELQADRDKLMSEIDVEIARNMLLSGHKKEDIIEAVRQVSPVSAEPGRGEDYAEYVEKQAEISIEKEQERLKYYRPMPRNGHEVDAEKEYEYHLQNIKSAFFLPYVPTMDVLIAEAMIAQGFQAAEIGAAMQKRSPCAINDDRYGNSIMRSLGGKPRGFGRTMEPPARVRTLGA